MGMISFLAMAGTILLMAEMGQIISTAEPNDDMSGGDGDDIYIVDSTSDTVTENSSKGTDLIRSSVSFTASADVENLTLTGSNNIDATGICLK